MLWKSAMQVFAFAAALYGALMLMLYLRQDGMIYYPDLGGREYEATPAQLGMPYEPVSLATSDGIRLDAWFVPAENARGVLLYAHGNGGNISHRLDAIRLFRDMGLSVFIFDYRGYGKSGGKPSEEGTYRDAEAAWQYLARRGIAPERIVLYGESLGGAVVTHLATQHQPGALILASALTSVPDMAAELYPWLPVRWLSRYRYDTRSYLGDVHAPVLVMHSREDDIIPYSHGRALYEAAHEPKQFVELRGGHNDLYFANKEMFMREAGKFVRQYLVQP